MLAASRSIAKGANETDLGPCSPTARASDPPARSAAWADIAGVGPVCIFMQSDLPFTTLAVNDVAFFRRARSRSGRQSRWLAGRAGRARV